MCKIGSGNLQDPMPEPNQTEFYSAITPTGPLIFPHLKKSDYFTQTTIATSNIMGQNFKYLMNDSQTNSLTQTRDPSYQQFTNLKSMCNPLSTETTSYTKESPSKFHRYNVHQSVPSNICFLPKILQIVQLSPFA